MICFLQGIVSHDPSRRSRRCLVESVATTNQKQMLPAFATTNSQNLLKVFNSQIHKSLFSSLMALGRLWGKNTNMPGTYERLVF